MLTYSDLVEPAGRVRAGMFPADDTGAFTARVSGWLTMANDATASVPWPEKRDDAARAWVYWQAFAALAERMASTPASVTNPDQQGGYAFTGGQLEHIASVAEGFRAEFHAIMATVPAQTTTPVVIGPPFSVPVSIRF